jgi:hypothetical protein
MLEDPEFVLAVLDDWLSALPTDRGASRDLTA